MVDENRLHVCACFLVMESVAPISSHKSSGLLYCPALNHAASVTSRTARIIKLTCCRWRCQSAINAHKTRHHDYEVNDPADEAEIDKHVS